MSDVQPIPPGSEGLIPHLVLDGAAEAIEFYQRAFDAEEMRRNTAPDGRIMHAELRVGGSLVYLCDDFPEFNCGKARNPKALGETPVTLHRFVTDTDAAVRIAEEAGATVTMPAADMFWGDRYGIVKDPWGHAWSFSTHVKDMTPEEIARAQAQAFSGPPSD